METLLKQNWQLFNVLPGSNYQVSGNCQAVTIKYVVTARLESRHDMKSIKDARGKSTCKLCFKVLETFEARGRAR
jgi:hypothetical protein